MPTDTQSIFSAIHRDVAWSGGWPETVSGAGSTLGSTAPLRAGLQALFASGVLPERPTLLDVPCGDFHWMAQVRGLGAYVGMDIVPELVEENARRHGSDTVRFLHGDLTRDPLPTADVLLCRDCLIHLDDALVAAALRNIARAGIPFVLLTTHGNAVNEPLAQTGGYRPINFLQAPFHFPEPLLRIPDHLGEHEKYLALWSAAQLRAALADIEGTTSPA